MRAVIEAHLDFPDAISDRRESESLAEYAERISLDHVKHSLSEERKARGQFFTPKEVARFMAGLFRIADEKVIRLLDPGAGTGMLTAAFCERILSLEGRRRLRLEVYENDLALLPFLKKVLVACKSDLEDKGHEVAVVLREHDFIADTEAYFSKEGPLLWADEREEVDYVISNPPYYKLNATSVHAKAMKRLDLGHPNVYALFMALSLQLLKREGELVFIIPRSFCSGLYYKKFRRWLLANASPTHIHSFESRREVFEHEGVLQENIILKAIPGSGVSTTDKVNITVSTNHGFEDMKKHRVLSRDIVHKMQGDALIKIPTSERHIAIQHAIEDWKYTLHDLGLDVSTGPIVDFRARDLLVDFINERVTAPLIWMHNIRDMRVVWPANKSRKQSGIRITKDAEPLLVPMSNYVLIKRFSSKEQERRLYAGAFLQKDFGGKVIGLENHVNYLYRKQGRLTPDETTGIAALLNTSFVDEYFRCLNGNTQVNASDLRVLPFPSLAAIQRLGRSVAVKKPSFGAELDDVVVEVLGLSGLNGKAK